VIRTAFAKEFVYRIGGADLLRTENLGIISKLCEDGESEEEQLKKKVLSFQKNYFDTGNSIWRRIDAKSQSWLEKYKMVFGGRNLSATIFFINDIIAIEIIGNITDGSYLIYTANDPSNPFRVDSIRFPNFGNRFLHDGIYNEYKPSKSGSDQYKAMIKSIDTEALPFLIIHQSVLVSMVYYKSIVPSVPDDSRQVSISCIKNWMKNHHTDKCPNARGGYVEMESNRIPFYFPVSLGHEPARGYDGNQNVRTLLNQTSGHWGNWYSFLRKK